MLKIGSVALGKRPVIVAPVGNVISQLLDDARKAGTDMIELRVDQLRVTSKDFILKQIKSIKEKKFPVILTIRKKDEGGVKNISDAARLKLFKELMSSVDAVDIEFFSNKIKKDVIDAAHAAGKKAIVSFHAFDFMPSTELIKTIIKLAKKDGADIVKICVMVYNSEDKLTLAVLMFENQSKNLVIIGMGKEGRATRFTLPLFGSLFTYGFIKKANAPGQMSVKELKNIFSKFK